MKMLKSMRLMLLLISFVSIFAFGVTNSLAGNFMVIKIKASNGKVVSVTDENNVPAQEGTISSASPLKIGDIKGHEVGSILVVRSSPGCVYFMHGGRWYRVCW